MSSLFCSLHFSQKTSIPKNNMAASTKKLSDSVCPYRCYGFVLLLYDKFWKMFFLNIYIH